MTFKDLIKTTEGAVVLGGLALTVISPILSPKVWALITGIVYVFINLPNLWATVKGFFNKLFGGSTD